jgi:hypothetical protein
MRQFFLIVGLLTLGCGGTPTASSGVKKADAVVVTGSDGLTEEQRNIQKRLEQDNLPGAIKHLYVVSAYSGQTILYSTVKGKVSSSGKRLSPSSVAISQDFRLPNGRINSTNELIGDDGAYGSSDPYIYWYDVKGAYHQHYPSGGQIIHISDQPVTFGSVTIRTEAQ